MAGSEELVNIDHPQMRFNHRSRVMGDATTCKQWLDKATVQKSLKRCTFSTLLKLARVLDIRVPVQYSHDSRSFPHPNIEDIAWLIANKVRDMNDELDRAERAIAAPAAPVAVPARTLTEAIAAGDAIFGVAQGGDDNDTSSSEDGTAPSMFRPAVAPTEAATATTAQPANDDTWEWRITMTKPEAEVIVEHSLSLEAWQTVKNTLTDRFEGWFEEHDVKAMFEGAIEGINSTDSESATSERAGASSAAAAPTAAPTEAAAAAAAQPAATERRRWEAKPYTVQGEDNVFEDDFHWGCTIAKVEAEEDEHVKAYCEAHGRQQLTDREWQVLKMYMARRVNMGDADVALPFKRIVRGMARHFVRQASSSGTSTDSDSEKGSENPSPTKSEDISIWFHPSATEAAAAAAAPVAPTEAAAAASSSTTEQKDKKKKKGKQDKKDDKLYQ